MKKESLYDESWKMLRHFQSQIEAAVVLGRLQAEGIPCYKLDDSIPGLGGSRIYVKSCDLELAEDVCVPVTGLSENTTDQGSA